MGNKTGNLKGGRLREMVAYESGRSKRVNCMHYAANQTHSE